MSSFGLAFLLHFFKLLAGNGFCEKEDCDIFSYIYLFIIDYHMHYAKKLLMKLPQFL